LKFSAKYIHYKKNIANLILNEEYKMKKSGEEKKEQIRKNSSKSTLFRFILIGFVLAIGYGVWQNFEQIKSAFEQKTEQEPIQDTFAIIENKADKEQFYTLLQKLNDLQAIVGSLAVKNSQSVDVSALEDKINSLETLINTAINGKADANSVLGLVTRTDKIETEVDRLSRINNDGALTLTAVMMVKENALDGKDFSYSAEVLSELAGNNPKISAEIDTIKNLSGSKILSDKELLVNFAKVYEQLTTKTAKEQIEKSWQDRLRSKLNELVTVKKIDENDTAAAEEKDDFFATLRTLFESKNICKIAAFLKNSDNAYISEDPDVKQWLVNVENKAKFAKATDKIANYSLLLIKLNNLGLRNN